MRLGKLLVIILFVAVLAMPSIICSEETCKKASKIITITNTPQIEPGEEGKLEFNVTSPYGNPSGNADATGGDMNLGTTLYVGGSGPGNYSSIQNAIDDASDGDTVFVYDDSSPYYENIEVDKSITLEGENRDTTVIDGGGTGDVARVSDDWVNISGFTIQNSGSNWNDKGIEIHSNHNTISWSIITNNNDGIYLINCSNNAISNCDCYNNLYGIWIWLHSSNNDITNCAIYNNSYDGIYIRDSSNNNISNCNIYDNSRAIYLRSSSSNNTIYHNNIINNAQNAYDTSSNVWDNGYPYGGNYWSDYNGTDSDGDGIGDMPYDIPGGDNQDRYPLMEPWNDTTAPEISDVQANPSSQETGKWVNITCNVTDNMAMDTVMVNITGPAGFIPINVSMNEGSYYYNATYTIPGTYNYFIWANDTNENTNTSSEKTFSIFTKQYKLTTSVTPSGSGYITLSPSGGTYNKGTIVTATAHANSGYEFNYWSGDATGSSITATMTMNSDKNIIAHFKSTYYPPPNPPPTANFTYSPEKPTTLDIISFTDLSSDDGTIINRTWDFGDGSSSYEQNPNHQYLDDRTYTVTLTVKDDDGATDITSQDIIVIVSDIIPSGASKIISMIKTPQIKPGEEGKLDFNMTNPYSLPMKNVSMSAEIYYYVEYTWFTDQESCEIEKVGNPPKFGNFTATNITIYWEKIPSNFTETKSLSIHSSKKTDQGTYFIRFQLEFDYSDTHYKMKSIGYFSREEWENATSNASGYFGGVNISMLGVDGIIPETTFGVKEPIPLWPLYLLIAVTAFLGIVAVRSYMKSGGVKEETKEMKIGIDDELIMELEKERATTEKKMGELEKEKPEGYKEKIEELQRNLENISFEIDRLKRGA